MQSQIVPLKVERSAGNARLAGAAKVPRRGVGGIESAGVPVRCMWRTLILSPGGAAMPLTQIEVSPARRCGRDNDWAKIIIDSYFLRGPPESTQRNVAREAF